MRKVFWPGCWAIELVGKHPSERATSAMRPVEPIRPIETYSIVSFARRMWRLSMFKIY